MDQFISNMELRDLLDVLKQVRESDVRKGKMERHLHEYRKRYGDRFILGGLCNLGDSLDFVSTVQNRGSNGRYRTILLKDVRLFGIKFLSLTDHMWVRYSRAWENIEPFLQGQKVILHGKVIEYDRANGEISYTVDSSRVLKL